MSQSAHPAVAPRRRRWLLFLPFTLVVLLAVAWTGVLVLCGRARGGRIAAGASARRRPGGCRLADPVDRRLSVPHRGALRRGQLRAARARRTLPAEGFRSFWPPCRSTSRPPDQRIHRARSKSPSPSAGASPPSTGRSARPSVRGLPSGVERASLVLDAPTVRDSRVSPATTSCSRRSAWSFMAAGHRLDARQSADRNRAARVNAAVADKLHPLAAQPIDADIAADAARLDDISPKPWPDAVPGMAGARRPARDHQARARSRKT